jgi:hypothetical protein
MLGREVCVPHGFVLWGEATDGVGSARQVRAKRWPSDVPFLGAICAKTLSGKVGLSCPFLTPIQIVSHEGDEPDALAHVGRHVHGEDLMARSRCTGRRRHRSTLATGGRSRRLVWSCIREECWQFCLVTELLRMTGVISTHSIDQAVLIRDPAPERRRAAGQSRLSRTTAQCCGRC